MRSKDRQGFDPRPVSAGNLKQLRENLKQGSSYLESCVEPSYSLTPDEKEKYKFLGKLGITKDEALIFQWVTDHLTIQHATQDKSLKINDTLKSVRTRLWSGENIENYRTSDSLGRQKFIYFVTGIGEQINAPGLEKLPTFVVSLKKLKKNDPKKFHQLHISPHLSEFSQNNFSDPIVLGETKVDIEFCQDNMVIYTYARKSLKFKIKYSLNDFVFYGGDDVITGIALYFIQFLRFVGEPYQTTLISQLSSNSIAEGKKIKILGKLILGLMPGSMLIEAKIPDELKLDSAYAILLAEKNVLPLI